MTLEIKVLACNRHTHVSGSIRLFDPNHHLLTSLLCVGIRVAANIDLIEMFGDTRLWLEPIWNGIYY